MGIKELEIENLESAANMLKAIAHPIRIAIIGLLEYPNRLTVSKIHKELNIEQSTASHHLGILKDKGILCSKRDGKNTYYFLKHKNFFNIIECIGNCPLL